MNDENKPRRFDLMAGAMVEKSLGEYVLYAEAAAPAPIQSAEVAELRKLAEAATPGPWIVAGHDGLDAMVRDAKHRIILWRCNGFFKEGTEQADKDAAYLAAANPAVILRLLAAFAAQPEQAKPTDLQAARELTDAEILAVLTSVDPTTKRLPPGFKLFARAIERHLSGATPAHGGE